MHNDTKIRLLMALFVALLVVGVQGAALAQIQADIEIDTPHAPGGHMDHPQHYIWANDSEIATVTLTLTGPSGPIQGESPTLSVNHGIVMQELTEVSGRPGVYEATVKSDVPGTTRVLVRLGATTFAFDGLLSFRQVHNDPTPVLTISPLNQTREFTIGGDPVWLDPAMSLGMAPTMSVSNLKIEVEMCSGPRFVGGDQHGCDGNAERSIDKIGFYSNGSLQNSYSANGVTGTVDSSAPVITLTGSATAADFEAALRTIAYRREPAAGMPTGPNAGPRTVRLTISQSNRDVMPGSLDGGSADTTVGRYYEYIDGYEEWFDAEREAANRTLFGLQGYLATVTSQAENDVISVIARQSAWLGGSDDEEENVWRWVTGPETGQQFWQGLSTGHPVNGMYNNWGDGEPNNSGNPDENFLQIFGHIPPEPSLPTGRWNDLYDYETWVQGYVVEYGGMEGDPEQLVLTAQMTIHVVDRPTAQFELPNTPLFGQTVAFIDQSFGPGDPTGANLTHSWEFGDGATSNDRHPTHQYATPGKYTVKLTVTDVGNNSQHAVTEEIDVRSAIVGRVFDDINHDTVWDPVEPGPGNFGVDLDVVLIHAGTPAHRAPDATAGHIFDSGTGRYYFHYILPGEYTVRVVERGTSSPHAPDGYLYTRAPGSAPETLFRLPAVPTPDPIVDPGEVKGPSFGFSKGRIVTGSVFVDDGRGSGTANDGARSGGEPGLSGVRVRLIDSGDTPLATGLTGPNGDYRLVGYGDPSVVRLVVPSQFNPTGYTRGDGGSGEKLGAFPSSGHVDIPLILAGDGYDFGVVPHFGLAAPDFGVVPAGGVTVYPFSATLGTHGNIAWHIASDRGWDYDIYIDEDGDGRLRAGDRLVTGGAESLGPGRIDLLLVVRVPTSAGDGAVDSARVEGTFSYDGNTALSETSGFFGVTTVQSSRLRLAIYVRNETLDHPPADYSPTAVEGKRGDVLEYRIQYSNIGPQLVKDAKVYVNVPTGTALIEDAYDDGDVGRPVQWSHHDKSGTRYPLESGDPNATAGIEKTASGFVLNVGEVEPGQMGSFTYRVTLE